MRRIAFVHARFFRENETDRAIADRLAGFLRVLRIRRHARETGMTEDAAFAEDIAGAVGARASIHLDEHDIGRIRARVERITGRRRQVSGLEHLRSEDRNRLRVLEGGASLGNALTEHRADEIAAAIHSKYPWFAEATDQLWRALRMHAQSGQPGVRFAPILLDGAPGIGKTAWAKDLSDLLGLPTLMFDCTTENASFGLTGSQRGWSSAHSGRLLEAIMATCAANQVVILDEIDKAGNVRSDRGMSFSLEHALLPLLEPVTAAAWLCPYFQVRFDMSWLCWILTTNASSHLSAPLRSRCPPLHIRDPTQEELVDLASREGERLSLSEDAIGSVTDAIRNMFRMDQRVDVRTVRRMFDRAVSLEARPWTH